MITHNELIELGFVEMPDIRETPELVHFSNSYVKYFTGDYDTANVSIKSSGEISFSLSGRTNSNPFNDKEISYIQNMRDIYNRIRRQGIDW